MPTHEHINDQVLNAQNEIDYNDGSLSLDGQSHVNVKLSDGDFTFQSKTIRLENGVLTDRDERMVFTDNHAGTVHRHEETNLETGEVREEFAVVNANKIGRNDIVHTKADGVNEVFHQNFKWSDFEM